MAKDASYTPGALARRDQFSERPFGFHRLRRTSVCVRLTLVERGSGTDRSLRMRAEFIGAGEKPKPLRTDRRCVIDWWENPAFDLMIRALVLRESWDLAQPRTFVINGLGETMPS